MVQEFHHRRDSAVPPPPRQTRPAWVSSLKRFEKPDARKATLQLLDTAVPYFALLLGMYFTIYRELPYWVTLLLSVPTAGFMVRLFIVFHDCSHGSYLSSRRGMKIIGTLIGIVTFIPFAEWRTLHAIHHSSSGNLDRRGVGDVWTMTVEEYLSKPWHTRLLYRIFRNPAIMFGLGALYLFLIAHRIPSRGARKDQIVSVLLLDAILAVLWIVAALTIGLKAYVMIQLPIMTIGGAAGVWLFYVQHQFDPTYWSRNEHWDSLEAALQGSSFYKLPKVLQWFSGNIGFHHVHHLRPRIPNYNLERCLKETPELQLENPLTLWTSFRSVRLNLWDEKRRTLVGFRDLRGLPSTPRA